MLHAGPQPGDQQDGSNGQKPVAPATATKPSAVTAVPTPRRTRSPTRSARNPAGTWKSAMPPLYADRITPTWVKESRSSAAHRGRKT